MSSFPSSPRTRSESFADGLTVRFNEQGSGRPMLLLHGGGGPQTMFGLASALSRRAHVLTPTPPGFVGEPRPEWFDSIDDLAFAYLDLLEPLDLPDVLVIGSSMGRWIAPAMALRATTRLLSGLVLLDTSRLQVEVLPLAVVPSFP